MRRALQRVLAEPVPARFLLLRFLDRRFDLLDYRWKLNLGSLPYPHYGYCLLAAAELARALGHSRISALEFGVGGGNGLVALERHAARVQRETGVEVAVFGFDSGTGMPQPQDYRDIPYMWQGGYYAMDQERLARSLTSASLVLGPVEETVPQFCAMRRPPPIGFIAFDLDYYSSTRTALTILQADPAFLLPRVACYFDDIVGDLQSAHNEFTGVRLAIAEFNRDHADRKIARVRGLRHFGPRIPRLWHEQVHAAHLFGHPDYVRPINPHTQMTLDPDAPGEGTWSRV